MPRDLTRELDDTPDSPTTTWDPNVGDKLIGVIRAKDQVPSKFNSDLHTRLVVEDEQTGELVQVFCHHAVLEREMTEQQPAVGDRIAIKRLQDVPGKNYRRYKVIVEHVESDDASTGDNEDTQDDIPF